MKLVVPAGDRWTRMSCYANVVVQFLLSSPVIVWTLMDGFRDNDGCVVDPPCGTVLFELQNIVRVAFQLGARQPVSPTNVIYTLDGLRVAVDRHCGNRYDTNEMQDVAEFFGHLLSAVNFEACSLDVAGAVRGELGTFSSVEEARECCPRDPLSDFFYFAVKTTRRCDCCRTEVTTYDNQMFWEAYGVGPKSVNLPNLLSSTCELTGDNQGDCDICAHDGRGLKHNGLVMTEPVVDNGGANPLFFLVLLGGRQVRTCARGTIVERTGARVFYPECLECMGHRRLDAVVLLHNNHYTVKVRDVDGDVLYRDNHYITTAWWTRTRNSSADTRLQRYDTRQRTGGHHRKFIFKNNMTNHYSVNTSYASLPLRLLFSSSVLTTPHKDKNNNPDTGACPLAGGAKNCLLKGRKEGSRINLF